VSIASIRPAGGVARSEQSILGQIAQAGPTGVTAGLPKSTPSAQCNLWACLRSQPSPIACNPVVSPVFIGRSMVRETVK